MSLPHRLFRTPRCSRRVLLAVTVVAFGCTPESSPSDSGDTADTGASPPAWTAPDETGPYDCGVETFDYTDPRGKEMTIEVWYPARVDDDAEPDPYPELPFSRESYREADPDRRGAPYPVVAFSHGYGGIRYQSIFLTEYLAQHGFVVVAPDHPGNTFLDYDEDAVGQVMAERPDDVRYAVDELFALADGGHERLGEMVDSSADYAMTGHSFGAITTLVMVGGELDGEAMAAWCDEHGGWICSQLEGVDPDLLTVDIEGDDRAAAPVAMSPGLWYAFGSEGEGLEPVSDILFLGGTLDDLFDYEDDIRRTWDLVSPYKALGTVEGAGHYAFSDICEVAWTVLEECDGEEAGYIEMETAHAITQVVVTAWLGMHLVGDDRYAPWLEADAYASWPEFTWEEEEATAARRNPARTAAVPLSFRARGAKGTGRSVRDGTQ